MEEGLNMREVNVVAQSGNRKEKKKKKQYCPKG